MILGILADTHNELERTKVAVEMLRNEGAELLIHCGDLALPDIVEACAVVPFHFTFGNHDADNVPLLRQAAITTGSKCLEWGGVLEFGGKRVGVVHGHMRADLRRVLALQPHYLLRGHSHMTADEREGDMRRINPGALFRAEEHTVALLDVERDELRFITVPRGR
jgi:putative phosphoesterase